jgi:hypothetical protein
MASLSTAARSASPPSTSSRKTSDLADGTTESASGPVPNWLGRSAAITLTSLVQLTTSSCIAGTKVAHSCDKHICESMKRGDDVPACQRVGGRSIGGVPLGASPVLQGRSARDTTTGRCVPQLRPADRRLSVGDERALGYVRVPSWEGSAQERSTFGHRRHHMSTVFHAGQAVITALRQVPPVREMRPRSQ